MSEPTPISPLLDGFVMGSAISEHNGVSCCPAIKEHTDKKYIVKIISIPASQTQMDALLLAGAYKDPADVMDYFKSQGEGILWEAELLQQLSRLEGFLPYEGWQMEPITRRRLGYQVYLLGSYKKSLEKHLRRHPVTHLEAVNLGLDLCSALSVCREAGALYVDLKPTNIFVSDKMAYRIGDIGFLRLEELSYAALPEKYHSPYTPPELLDPMAPLNLTVDTYGVGMILYQLYNDGQLPPRDRAPEEELPSPVNADYELAEIIMKAIHPDPEQRWTDPRDMGKALAAYMQRNAINDVSITPHTPLVTDPNDVVVLPPKAEEDSPAQESSTPEVSSPAPSVPETPTPQEASPEEVSAPEDISGQSQPESEEIPADPKPSEEAEPSAPPVFPPEAPENVAPAPAEPAPEEPESSDSPAPSDELSRILARADDLISHETPTGVVLPEIPDPPDPFAFVHEDSEELEDSSIPEDPVMEDEAPDTKAKGRKKPEKKFLSDKRKKRVNKFFSTLLTLLILAALACGAFWYYQNRYLQTIRSLTIQGDRSQLTVSLDTDVDETLLSVTCSDNYGNVRTQSVTAGQASFQDLSANTLYTIQVEIEGFHALTGQISDVYTTDATTRIVSFTCVTGAEDGSVMLNFTVDGEEPRNWTLTYSTEDGESHTRDFTGHSLTVSDLAVGKVYTFTLSSDESLSLDGETSLTYMASRLILAENLSITSNTGSDISVTWNAPGDIVVDSWDVRCYSDNGYEEQRTVTETSATFTGIDLSESYTVEVTASGMTQPARTSITANPLIVTGWDIQELDSGKLNVTWDFTGTAPEGGWLLLYAMDGNSRKDVVKCDTASAAIAPLVPGARYSFTLQSADSTTVFSNTHTYTCAQASAFDQYNLSAEHLTMRLLKTPEQDSWYCENIPAEDFTDSFASGDSISIALSSDTSFYLPGNEVSILYVIRDTHGNVIPDLISEETVYWKNIWNGGNSKNGELDLPKAPTSAGEYVLNLYFDGQAVAEASFRISE